MAINTQTLEGAWNEVKGRIRDRWGELTDDDLQRARGNVDKLVGLIQRKTGETRAVVVDYLDEITSDVAEAIDTTAETLRDYISTAAKSFRETSRQALRSMKHGYEQTEDMVRRRPVESLAACFGLGIIAGVLVGWMFHNHSR